MKVVVTGHHGYIGSVLAPTLEARGHEVTGLDTFLYRGCDFISDGIAIPALDLDVRDVTQEHLRGYDAIVHLAALSNDPLGELNPGWTEDVNFHATARLAAAAKSAGVRRFLFASSCSMYGAANTVAFVSEDEPLRPLTAYAESKVHSEKALAELAAERFSPVFLRNATAYGVSPRLRADVVLNNLVGWAFTTGRIKLLSDGSPWRPLVHIEDIAECVAALLEAPLETVHNQAFNVGADGENYQVRDLAEIVRETFPDCTIELAKDAGPDPRSYRVDFGKLARALPDFKFHWTARSGALQLMRAFKRANITREDFEGPRFTRVKQLRSLLNSHVLDDDMRWVR